MRPQHNFFLLGALVVAAAMLLGACDSTQFGFGPAHTSLNPFGDFAKDDASPPRFNPPKSVYLALGTSLAFGFQNAKFVQNFSTEDPAAYKTGYVDDFARDLALINPKIQTVNLGCPGETTDSMLGLTPCFYHPPFPLHANYTGSQLDAALAVLRAHPGRVSPVTIDIGINDLLKLEKTCAVATGTPYNVCVGAGLPAVLAHARANLSTIFAKLRHAAPRTEIIVLGAYNPRIFLNPGTDVFTAELNTLLAQQAARYRARFADPLPVFNPTVHEIPTICALTLVCKPPTDPLHLGGELRFPDPHPTDLGYQKLADLVFAASGYCHESHVDSRGSATRSFGSERFECERAPNRD